MIGIMYSAEVLDHFANPRHAGDLPGATAAVEVENPVCGDVLRLSIRVEGQGIIEARFQAKGCVASVACGSCLAEMLFGKSLADARSIRPEDVTAALGGLPEESLHASRLACDAVTALLRRLPAHP